MNASLLDALWAAPGAPACRNTKRRHRVSWRPAGSGLARRAARRATAFFSRAQFAADFAAPGTPEPFRKYADRKARNR